MHHRSYYAINAITFYRLIASQVLLFLVFTGNQNLFKWLLALSFFTDLIDGFLARKFKVTSVLGSRIDSIADDLTIVAATVGLFVFKRYVITENLPVILVLLALFIIQAISALLRYQRMSSFHTYLAKTAAIAQGLFLVATFFTTDRLYILFYVAAILTILDLMEEIMLVFILPKWKTNVRGIYWIIKKTGKQNLTKSH